MRVARGTLLRNLAGSIGVLCTVAGLAFGLPALDNALPAQRPAGDGPYQVGGRVVVTPPPGARLDVTLTRPGDTRGTVVFVAPGAVRYVIVVTPFKGSLAAAAERLKSKIKRGHEITGTERPVRTAGGLEGLEGSYAAPGRAGRYLVFRAGDVAIEVTVAGSAPALRAALAAIEASTRTLAYRGGTA
ncbi:hypothetical protein [Asanoa siamensis]|uniref:Lipoprotein LpqN n=1 Tax=Asanoa siamensis TaxID=926357 RepID=A0ABQ4CTW3_9ACTN|nr:hypothetical protein [Asanoa siamensis]GIF74710.1 hypothetical protein Asi02nite_42280 [Asanoa siamensis]